MNNLISLAFWFNSRPELIGGHGQKALVAMATILLIIALVIFVRAYSKSWSVYRPTLQRLIPFCLTNAVIALYFLFLNSQVIPVLRARYWYVIWTLIGLAWIYGIINNALKRARRKESLSQEAEKRKYLPK